MVNEFPEVKITTNYSYNGEIFTTKKAADTARAEHIINSLLHCTCCYTYRASDYIRRFLKEEVKLILEDD